VLKSSRVNFLPVSGWLQRLVRRGLADEGVSRAEWKRGSHLKKWSAQRSAVRCIVWLGRMLRSLRELDGGIDYDN